MEEDFEDRHARDGTNSLVSSRTHGQPVEEDLAYGGTKDEV
jgi:hypothetical protein